LQTENNYCANSCWRIDEKTLRLKIFAEIGIRSVNWPYRCTCTTTKKLLNWFLSENEFVWHQLPNFIVLFQFIYASKLCPFQWSIESILMCVSDYLNGCMYFNVYRETRPNSLLFHYCFLCFSLHRILDDKSQHKNDDTVQWQLNK
jgi:hypothetical protein